VLTAYCPLARGRIKGDPLLTDIGRRSGKTCAQVVLRWLIQQQMIAAIPRSTNAARLAENIDVFDFKLDDKRHAPHRRPQTARRPHRQSCRPDAGVGCVIGRFYSHFA
jgi:diketogulonate reductase-like aldo/keto reductase